MRSLIGLLFVFLALESPASLRAQGANLEPCFIYEIEEAITVKGENKSGRKTCFTDAELPWASLGLAPPHYLLETGFKLTKEPAKIVFGGANKDGTKLTWKRDQGGNVHAASVHFWVLKDVETPMFKVRLGQNYLEFLVPAGCVKMEVVPLTKSDVKAGEFAIKNSVGATGELGRALKYKLGNKELQAQEFVCKVADGPYKGTLTYTLSKGIPEGICSIVIDGEIKAAMRVAAMTPAPAPRGLDVFTSEGFAYAPAAGYRKAPKPRDAEVVRYVNADGDFISVTLVKLDKGGLVKLEEEFLSNLRAPKGGLAYVGRRGSHHLAGHQSFYAEDRKTKVYYVFTQNGGRGYKVGVSKLEDLTHEQTLELFRGWRWIDAAKKSVP